MAITIDERNDIINSVLKAIKTNSRTIEQLSAVTSLADTDCIEISGGKKVTYAVLRELINSMSADDIQALYSAVEDAQNDNLLNRLKEVTITTTADTATLKVSTMGWSKSCTIPVVTADGVGVITPITLAKINNTYTLASNNKVRIDKIEQEVGAADGICPLNEQGKIDDAYLPEQTGKIYTAEFDGFSDNTNASAESLNASSTDTGVTIIFDRYLQAFVAVKALKAYRNWTDTANFGNNRGAGAEPFGYALYVNTQSNTIWKYIGGEMTQVGADISEVREYVAQAQEYADNAEQSATDAAKMATSASDSANDASTSASQAQASATAAEESNTEAKANAHSAFLMASNAQNAANEAAKSMEAASASATKAGDSVTSAKLIQNDIDQLVTAHRSEMETFSENCKYRYVTLNFGENEETMQLANIDGAVMTLDEILVPSSVESVYITTPREVKVDITHYTSGSDKIRMEAYEFATFDIVRTGTGNAAVGLKFKIQ